MTTSTTNNLYEIEYWVTKCPRCKNLVDCQKHRKNWCHYCGELVNDAKTFGG